MVVDMVEIPVGLRQAAAGEEQGGGAVAGGGGLGGAWGVAPPALDLLL